MNRFFFLFLFLEEQLGSLTFPAYTDVLPCPNTPEVCARTYYNYQTNQQTQLDQTYNSAADAQDSAGALLATVQGLLGNSTALIAQIDPDNSRTSGGQIRKISATQSSLVGVTPYMATISQRMVSSANQRETDLANLVSALSSGMGQITNILTNAESAANSQLTSMTSSFQNSINGQSTSLQDFFNQMDAKLVQASSLFDTSSNAGPNATANGLVGALQMEASDFANTRSKLVAIYEQINEIPNVLGTFLNKSINSLTAYQQQQEALGNSLSANTSAQFAAQLITKANLLTAKLNGILATAVSDPYYNSSLTAYMANEEAALEAQMQSTNRTEQSQITGMLTALKSISKTVASSFQPILSDMATWVTRIVSSDAGYQKDAQTAFNDAAATVTKTNSTFQAFTANMQNIWNTTGSILSGQTTAISENLLNQIGNMTSQAGAEVNNLNALMLEASHDALQSDAVRQAILNGSSQQVITMIGSNANAVNQSIATIKNFLNNSRSEISLIMNVLQLMSGSQIDQLNQTASAAISGVQNQISILKNATDSSLSTLVKSVNEYLQTSQTATDLVYSALQQAGQSSMNQANALISAMNDANNQSLGKTEGMIDSANALVNRAIADSNSLTSAVNSIPQQAQIMQQNQLSLLNQIVGNATANLSLAQNQINSEFLSVKQTIEQAATSLGTNESNAVQAMASVLNSASSLFDQQTTALTTQFKQLLNALQANVTVSEARMSDMESQLSSAASAADSQFATSLAIVQNSESNSISKLKSVINAYVDAMQASVTSEATSQVNLVSGNMTDKLSELESKMTSIQGNVSALSATVGQLQNTPQSLVNKAVELQTQFASQLNTLKASIVSLSQINDAKISNFEAQVNSTFGAKVDGLLSDLENQISTAESAANASISNGISRLNKSVSTAESAIQLSASSFLSQIESQRNQTAISVNNVIENAYNAMNASVVQFSKNVSSLNASIYNTLNSSSILQARLADLEAQVNGTASQIGNSTQASDMSEMVLKYGETIAKEIDHLMTDSQNQLSSAQQSAVMRQLLTADSALGTASGINATGTALANAVQAAFDQIKSASQSMQANTAAVQSKLDAVSVSTSNSVNISATQIAAIISKYSQDSAATRSAIETQFAAAGNASISVQAAMNVWNSLKESATNLTTDQVNDLQSTQAEVFNYTDFLIQQTQDQANADVNNLTSSIKAIDQSFSVSHRSNMAIIDSLISKLNQIASSAAGQKYGFEQQVTNLRGSVNTLVNQLNARYAAITAQGAQFKSVIESAAAQDIAALTKNG